MPLPKLADAEAHRINEQPWEPMPGHVKLRCAECRFLFSSPDPSAAQCPDCAILERRRLPTLRPDGAQVPGQGHRRGEGHPAL